MLPGSLAALETAQLGPAAFQFSPLPSWSLARTATSVGCQRGQGPWKQLWLQGAKTSPLVEPVSSPQRCSPGQENLSQTSSLFQLKPQGQTLKGQRETAQSPSLYGKAPAEQTRDVLRPQWLNEEANKLPIKSKTVMLTKHKGSLVHLVMPGQVSEHSSGFTASLVNSLGKEGEDMGPNSVMAAVPRDTRDCKHQQDGQALKASWQPGIAVGKTLAKCLQRWKCSSVPLCKESERCFHEEWLWHSSRALETTKAVEKGGWNFQRVVSKVWKSPSPLHLGLCCRHRSTWHPRAGCRWENPMGIKPDTWQVPHVWIQMASLKWRPGLHPWHCQHLQTCSKGYLGCSFSEASRWKGGCDTQPIQFIFSPPHLHIWRNHRYKHGVFLPRSHKQ